MAKNKYDFIFSLGATCACSQSLREAGLQLASLPYDWTGAQNLLFKVKFLCDGFPGMLEASSLSTVDDPFLHCQIWQDNRGFPWAHDLRVGVPLADQLPAVQAKYARRIERFNRLMEKSRKVLAVYLDNKIVPSPSEDIIAEVQDMMSKRWPKAEIDVLFLRQADHVKPDEAKITEGRGYRIIDLDCRSNECSRQGHQIQKILGEFLGKRYSVADYRTPEEKREGPRKRRLAKYGKFSAKTYWGYQWNRLSYKLYRHLRKRMQRLGLAEGPA